MTSLELTIETVVAHVIARRAGSGADAAAVAVAARRAYDDLVVVLVPLIGEAGVDALVARALHVTTREYRLNQAEEEASEPFGRVGPWLERQKPTVALAAASTLLATFAALLATLIGEPLTMRYLLKAWPGDDFEKPPEGTAA